jgi:hypothetical protein
MKKLVVLVIAAFGVLGATAQDLKKVETAYLLNKFEDAKTEVDKAVTDPKQQGKPDVFYWKAKVYAELYRNDQLRAKYPNARQDADDAFQKYAQADPAFAKVKEKGAEGYFAIYGTAYKLGVGAFNEKKWEEAATDFKTAVEYSDLIFKNKWSNQAIPFDTTSILYLAYAYQNGSKPAEAAKYYSRLADAKVAGADYYQDVYRFLVNHYTVTKNEALFRKYLALGRETYPKYAWDEFEIDYMDQNMSLDEKVALFKKDDAAGTMSEIKYLQFGDIFVGAKNKNKDLDSAKAAEYSHLGVEAYKKAFAKNPQNGIAAYNIGVIYYNIYGEYDDKYAENIRTMQGINANKPAPDKDPKKRAAQDAAVKAKLDPIRDANAKLEKPLLENLDQSIEWLEKAYTIFKDKTNRTNTEKSVINKSVDFLANLYGYKRDKMRGKDTKAFDAFDAKFKEFDALHGKF